MIFGFYLELKLANQQWFAEPFGIPRQFYRSAHVHGNLLAVLNLLYALFIGTAALSDSLKRWGSYLMVAGSVLIPVGILVLAAGGPPFLSPLGAISTILAVAIMAYGHK